MRVIGTAGHVDHGKSTLVEALTGVHPDRLKEEQEREMTIDLGFAWLKLPDWARLPDADEIGIVDVPGHRDFIDNMLAGVGGIDAALFVIAADEGVMPQSREHLAILDLLQIQTGVLALTKIDLVDDPEWLSLVEEEARQLLHNTALQDAPIVRVSAVTREGLDDLIREISKSLSQRPPRSDIQKPRLPIDRVFTISGFGTVVTGTLSDGQLKVGEEIEILPVGHDGRIRGIQSHSQKSEIVDPGTRTAVNISGLDKDQIKRGDVLAHPGVYQPTRRLDVEFRLIPDSDTSVKHDMEVKLFIGATESLGRVRLIGSESLERGGSGWLQLELRDPVVAARGDRYILRRPSPGSTLGGGVVLDPHPTGRHRRFSAIVLERMEALAEGTPGDVLLQTVLETGPASYHQIANLSGLEGNDLGPAVEEAIAGGEIVVLDSGSRPLEKDSILASESQWRLLSGQVLGEIDAYHDRFPLRKGSPKEELRSRLKLSPQVFNAAKGKLIADGALLEDGPILARPDHEIQFDSGQETAVKDLLRQFADNPFSPPSVREASAEVGEDVFDAMIQLDVLVPVSVDVVFRREDYDRMVADIQRDLDGGKTISIAEFRDRYGTSRKYALAFLEHLDEIGVTVRDGDVRRLK